MPYFECELPKYPCTYDMWDALREEKRPILIYGMGNGADKLIARFEQLNIRFSDIFASDGFVRGHSFHGIRVKSFSEVHEMYSEFVIVLSFASNRPEVIDMLAKIDGSYEMYIPDMPVAGEEYFDREFYNEHFEEIMAAYCALGDSDSRNAFAAVVSYKLTGKMKYLLSAYSEKSEIYSLISSGGEVRSLVDCGAYNGDTLREAIEFFDKLEEAVLIEPDAKTFKRLLKYTDKLDCIRLSAYNAAVWSECGDGSFQSSGNRNSSVSSTASYDHRDGGISLVTLDSVAPARVDYIKYDVEGAELEALMGSNAAIISHAPALLVSLYHRSRDIFSLVLYIRDRYPGYKLYIRRLLAVPAWELDLIAIFDNA